MPTPPTLWGAARWPVFWQKVLKYGVIVMGAALILGLVLVIATIIGRL